MNGESLKYDIVLENISGIKNSEIVSKYTRIFPRVKQMCLLVKLWAKAQNIVGKDDMSNFSLVLMVIHFLQEESIIPDLQYFLRQFERQSPPGTGTNQYNSFHNTDKERESEFKQYLIT